jgi:hypothetical protein
LVALLLAEIWRAALLPCFNQARRFGDLDKLWMSGEAGIAMEHASEDEDIRIGISRTRKFVCENHFVKSIQESELEIQRV